MCHSQHFRLKHGLCILTGICILPLSLTPDGWMNERSGGRSDGQKDRQTNRHFTMATLFNYISKMSIKIYSKFIFHVIINQCLAVYRIKELVLNLATLKMKYLRDIALRVFCFCFLQMLIISSWIRVISCVFYLLMYTIHESQKFFLKNDRSTCACKCMCFKSNNIND